MKNGMVWNAIHASVPTVARPGRIRQSRQPIRQSFTPRSPQAELDERGEVRRRVGHQLDTRAVFGDAPLIEHEHVVGALQRREPMRDEDRGSSDEEPVDGLLDALLSGGIEPARRFVEDDEPGIVEEHAPERQELRLTRRQPHALAADQRVEPGGQARQPRGEVEVLEHRHEARVVGVLGEQREVVAERGLEQLDVLGDDSHRAAEFVQREIAYVDAVDAHAAAGRVVEPQQQAGQRALSASGAPDDAQDMTGGQRERHIVERERTIAVRERHVLELHRERARRQVRACAVDDRRPQIEQLGHAGRACTGLLQRAQLVGDHLERSAHELDRLEQQEHRADRDLTGVVEPHSGEEREHGSRRERRVAQRADLGAAPLGLARAR